MIIVLKIKLVPNGHWYTSKWDMIRSMRSEQDYIAVVSIDGGKQNLIPRAELLTYKQAEIHGEAFNLGSDGTVTKSTLIP